MTKKTRQVTCICGVDKNTMETNQVNEPMATYNALDDNNVMWLIEQVRKGINFRKFTQFANIGSFNLLEWAGFLNLTEPTMLRYKQEEKLLIPYNPKKLLK